MPRLPYWRSPRPSALGLGSLLVLVACGARGASFSAEVSSPVFRSELAGPAQAAACRSRGVILLEGSQGEDAVALVWFFGDSLHSDSVALGPPIWRRPGAADSNRSPASGAYRRTTPSDVLGYQTRTGWLRVQVRKDSTVTATFEAVLDRAGMGESASVRGRFDRVRVTADSTLCAIPRAAPDSGVPLRP